MTLYLGLCLHVWGLQASLEALQMRLPLSCRPPLIQRAALIGRAASNPRASAPVCLQLHGEPAHARQDQNTHSRDELEEALAEARSEDLT